MKKINAWIFLVSFEAILITILITLPDVTSKGGLLWLIVIVWLPGIIIAALFANLKKWRENRKGEQDDGNS